MRIKTLIAFLVLTVGGGLLIGSVSAPDQWYQNLVKPALNPPSWVFAPVWTILYVMIAVAGARVWSGATARPPARRTRQGLGFLGRYGFAGSRACCEEWRLRACAMRSTP